MLVERRTVTTKGRGSPPQAVCTLGGWPERSATSSLPVSRADYDRYQNSHEEARKEMVDRPENWRYEGEDQEGNDHR